MTENNIVQSVSLCGSFLGAFFAQLALKAITGEDVKYVDIFLAIWSAGIFVSVVLILSVCCGLLTAISAISAPPQESPQQVAHQV